MLSQATAHLYHVLSINATSLPLSPICTCKHAHTHIPFISLYCKGSSKLLVVGPHLCRADGCFSAPHGQHSGDEESSLRRKRLSICFSNCSSSPPSHLFCMASAATHPPTPNHLHHHFYIYLHRSDLTPRIHLAAVDDNVNT